VRDPGKFSVVGFLKDPTGVTALYLGKPEGKELVYMGKVGQDGLAPSPAKSGSNSKP
jgi:hypothetical protein